MRIMLRPGPLRLLCLTVTATLLSACGGGGSDSPEANDEGVTTAKIGVLPIVEVAPVYLGIEKGYYKDEGIDLQPQLAQGGAAVVPSVQAGEYQFGFSNVVSLMIAKSKGVEITMLTPSSRTTGQVGNDLSAVVVTGDSAIRTPKDLEGKRISVNTLQNIGHVTINASMEANGADGSNIDFREMPLPDMQAQLEGGRIDAAWVVEPFLSAILSSGGRAVLWNFADTDPNLIIAAYFTSDKLRSENPDLVDAFVRATTKSMGYAREHPDEVAQILTTYTEIPEERARGLVLPKFDPELDRDVLQNTADLVQKYGLTDDVPDVGALTGEQ